MGKSFHFKKDDYESTNGAKKHRFNAEYSGELEANSKKKQKTNQRKSRKDSYEFVDLN